MSTEEKNPRQLIEDSRMITKYADERLRTAKKLTRTNITLTIINLLLLGAQIYLLLSRI